MAKDRRDYFKAYNRAHKKEKDSYHKAYYQEHKDKAKEYFKDYYQKNKKNINDYNKADVNSFGKTKNSIRKKSNYYLQKHGTKIPGYQIHHCFTYDEPYKFIYCSIEKHLEIHQFLRDNKIEPDTNHYEQIKHLLDDTVIVYGV